MIQILQTKWTAIAVAVMAYALTTWLTLRPGQQLQQAARALQAAQTGLGVGENGPSWTFHNAELSQALLELKSQQEVLRARATALEGWEARLKSERQEICVVTQTVARLQADLDKTVTRIRDEETANLRKLAKVYAGMNPEGAAQILREMDDEQVVKLLALMKDSESAPLLEMLGHGGKEDAKRAALITNRLRLVLMDSKKPKTP